MPELIIDDETTAGGRLDHVVLSQRRGLIPRDYSKHPVGYLGELCPPMRAVDMPLVPRSDWSAIIKEMEVTKSRLSDIRRIAGPGQTRYASLDQNGQGYCVTADTEYLTPEGWVSVAEYDGSRPVATIEQMSNRMEYQYPSLVHQYEYNGEMLYSTNRRIDFGVTPNHRMYVRKWDESQRTLSDQYGFVEAKNIGWYVGLLAAPVAQIGTHFEELAIPGFVSFSGDDLFALLGLVVSDGFAGGAAKNQNVVSFASFRGQKRVQELAYRCGFRPKASNPAVWICTSHAFAQWVRENCYCGQLGAASKCVPKIIKAATPRQIQIFLEYFDDRNRDGSQFFSGSKRLIDDLQELHMLIGKRSHIGVREPRDSRFEGNRDGFIRSKLPQYVLTVGIADRLCLDKKKHIETDRYKGMVYCVTVPNSTIVTRRNGSVLYSGNCWAYSTGAAIMILRALANLPFLRLSPHAVACKIKNFRDEGGWGAASLEFAIKNGYPSIETWPEKSMSRQYDNEKTWAEASRNKVSEQWMDVEPPVYDRELTFDQVMTCLLNRIPVVSDFNWWGHSVCALDPVEVEPGSFGVRIINSWTDNWGDAGEAVLRGSKAIPDGATAPRVVTA